MYERFNDRTRKVMALANQEAQRFNHEYIDTEHILLGLLKEGSGVAANVLKNLGVELRRIRFEVEKMVQSGLEMVTMGKLPQTPGAKRVVEYSMEEARNLNHNYVGTEHILLGLLRESEGVAVQVLTSLGLRLEEVRADTLNVLGQGAKDDLSRPKSVSRMPMSLCDPKPAGQPFDEAALLMKDLFDAVGCTSTAEVSHLCKQLSTTRYNTLLFAVVKCAWTDHLLGSEPTS